MQTRLRTFTLVSVLGALLTVGAVPAAANFNNGPSSAGIVERFLEPGFAVWPDFEDGLLVFGNVNSVADACNGIPAGAGEVQEVTLPSGAIVILLHDDDVPVLVTPIGDPDVICGNPGAWPVIATGTGNVRNDDNDADVSLTRTNAFGSRLIGGQVVDGDGDAWSVQAHFRARITKNDEFVIIRENVNLVKRGK